jgi:hypothetical protein
MERPQLILDFRPRFPKCKSEHRGMFVGKNGPVAVIINEYKIRTPANGHWKAGRQDEVHRQSKARRPFVRGSKLRLCPVMCPD